MTREQRLERIIQTLTYRSHPSGPICPSYIEDTDLREMVESEDRALLEEVVSE